MMSPVPLKMPLPWMGGRGRMGCLLLAALHASALRLRDWLAYYCACAANCRTGANGYNGNMAG